MPFITTGGSGAGFALGSPDNLFGTTSGNALDSPVTVQPAASKAAAEAVRDTYATDNPDWLAGYDGNSNLNIRIFFTVDGNSVIVHQIRTGSAWVDNGSVTGVEGLPGSGTDFSGISDFHIPMIGTAPDKMPLDSGIARTDLGTGMYEAAMGMIFPRDSIQIGHAGVLSGLGALIKGRSFVTGRTFVMPFQYYDMTTGTERTRELSFTGFSRIPSQPDDSVQMASTGSFSFPSTEDEIIWRIVLKCPPNGTLSNFRMRMTIDGMTEPFFYFPDKSKYEDGTGVDVPSGADGIHILDISNSPMYLLNNPTINIDYAASSGVLLGTGVIPFFEIDQSVVSLVDLARVDEIPTTALELTDISSVGSGAIITAAERTKLLGIEEGATVTDLSTHSVTELNDVANAGSGEIITDTERTKLGAITSIGSGAIITASERTKLGEITSTGSGQIITTAERASLGSLSGNNANLIEIGSDGLPPTGFASLPVGNKSYRISYQGFWTGTLTIRVRFNDFFVYDITGLASGSNHVSFIVQDSVWQLLDGVDGFFVKFEIAGQTVYNRLVLVGANFGITGDVDLRRHSATELNDVTSSGSGAIITDTERTKLEGIEAGAEVNAIESVVAGANINIDATDPENPVISSVAAGGMDTDAIHDNVAGGINAVAEKTDPASADVLLLEDSEDSFNKKKVSIANLHADVDLATHSVTELFDVSSAGSGAIITTCLLYTSPSPRDS